MKRGTVVTNRQRNHKGQGEKKDWRLFNASAVPHKGGQQKGDEGGKKKKDMKTRFNAVTSPHELHLKPDLLVQRTREKKYCT
jgi:hypothetical protein